MQHFVPVIFVSLDGILKGRCLREKVNDYIVVLNTMT